MAEKGRAEAPDPGANDAADPEEAEQEADDTEGDDTEGQALTWKVRKPIPEAAEDAEG